MQAFVDPGEDGGADLGIASGGGGTMEHFLEAFTAGKADAVLAASVFHFGTFTVPDLKHYLRSHGVSVRLPSTNPPQQPAAS